MRIERLSLKNYRNLEDTQISFSPRVNLICGDNGQGKTNLIEAIWLLTGARSFRGSRDGDLIRFGEERAWIEAPSSARCGSSPSPSSWAPSGRAL